MIKARVNTIMGSVNNYTYIIAGGGASGLSLAIRLVDEFGPETRILIVDQSLKLENDRTWCFWHAGTPPFSKLISSSWKTFCVASPERGEWELPLGEWSYHMIRGIDFYQHAHEVLKSCDGVDFLIGRVDEVTETSGRGMIRVGEERYSARFVFDSCYLASEDRRERANGDFLWQDFHGWVVETPKDSFEPGKASLMDFRTPQDGETRFFYVLPISKTRALVEHTIFGKTRRTKEQHQVAIKNYLQSIRNIESYEILEEETGCIPMTYQLPEKRDYRRIIRLGALGGAVKPTTGFAFLRIQRQVDAIISALREGNDPQELSRMTMPRFRFYDSLLLHILANDGSKGMGIFNALFSRNPVGRVLKFLDESTDLLEEAHIFSTLPVSTFLKAVYSTTLQRLGIRHRQHAKDAPVFIPKNIPV